MSGVKVCSTLLTHTHTHTHTPTHTHRDTSTHYKTHTNPHIKNNIKPPQCKLKQTQYKIFPNEIITI